MDLMRRPATPKSRFARIIDALYGALFWFRIGGLVAVILVLIARDDLRHAVMRLLFNR